MSAENKALVRRYIEELVNNKNLEIIDELISPDFVDHNAPPGVPPTQDAYKQSTKGMLAAFPDVHLHIEDQIAEGDRVTTRFASHGTHQGEFLGIPATGKAVTISGIQIARVAGGKIVEKWEEVDLMGMMVQLGAVPAPGG